MFSWDFIQPYYYNLNKYIIQIYYLFVNISVYRNINRLIVIFKEYKIYDNIIGVYKESKFGLKFQYLRQI